MVNGSCGCSATRGFQGEREAGLTISPIGACESHSVIVRAGHPLYKRRARGDGGKGCGGKAMRSQKVLETKQKNGAAARNSAAGRNGHLAGVARVTPASREKNEGRKYRPTDREPFMNERQREYFRKKLLDWKEQILQEAKETLAHLQAENENHPDLADRASSETDRAIELRARDRQRKLIAKIDEALTRLDDGTYGYCEETGEPIALKRLEARPIATLSIEAQERHERRERVYRDD
jgi:RNA polymerase-binding transcription factor